jgi:hypothetical protein
MCRYWKQAIHMLPAPFAAKGEEASEPPSALHFKVALTAADAGVRTKFTARS